MTENEIGKVILDAAFKVHTILGPGLLESAYEKVLKYELERRGLRVARQVKVPIRYEDLVIDEGFVADLIVEDLVSLELKSVEQVIPVHKKQLLTYLRLTGRWPRIPPEFQRPSSERGDDSDRQRPAGLMMALRSLRPLREVCIHVRAIRHGGRAVAGGAGPPRQRGRATASRPPGRASPPVPRRAAGRGLSRRHLRPWPCPSCVRHLVLLEVDYRQLRGERADGAGIRRPLPGAPRAVPGPTPGRAPGHFPGPRGRRTGRDQVETPCYTPAFEPQLRSRRYVLRRFHARAASARSGWPRTARSAGRSP